MPEAEPAEQRPLDYWREHLATLEVTAELRESLPALVPGGFDGVPHLLHYVLGMDHSAPCYVIDARWGRRRPLLRLRDAHRQRGEAVLRELGMPQDAWFVCVHAREGGGIPPPTSICTPIATPASPTIGSRWKRSCGAADGACAWVTRRWNRSARCGGSWTTRTRP